MERKIINGKEYIFERIKIEDKLVTILCAISPQNSRMVEFSSKRPKQMNSSEAEFIVACSIQEFEEEMKYLCNYIDKKGISDESFLEAFQQLCKKHINEIGRLIDTDLYNYIDKAIILQNSIYVSYGSQLNEDQAEKIWIELLKLALQSFNNYIYITQYDLSNPMNPRPFLVKLTDIQK